MGENRSKSKCDALKIASSNILEEYRHFLETSDPPIRTVRIELRIRAQDAVVDAATIAPYFETHPEQRRHARR